LEGEDIMSTKPVVIRFFAPVIDATVNALMSAIDQKMKQGAKEFIILISSPGGSVVHLSLIHISEPTRPY